MLERVNGKQVGRPANALKYYKNQENRVWGDFPIKNLEEREDKYFNLFS
jgi:hypothetical protein